MSAASTTEFSGAEQLTAVSSTPAVLRIPVVEIVFHPYRGAPQTFATDNSAVLFRRLSTAARHAERIVSFTARGETLDAESRGALNSYLRTLRLGRGAEFPFNRLPQASQARTRYKWTSFAAYLGFSFVA